MKILVGYVLALAVMFGGFVTGWTWLTTEPVSEPARKPVIAKIEPAPVIERDETVSFPEPPPRPAIAAVQDASAVAPAPAMPVAVAPATTVAATSPDSTDLSAFAKGTDKVEPPQVEPAKPVARVAKKKPKPQPRYEMMIQQTVQLPDGRIIQRLIPMSARTADAYAQYRYR